MASIREQIMVLVKAKLETITTSNGYNTDVQKVERFRITPVSRSELPSIYIFEEKENVTASGAQVNLGLYASEMIISLECWVKDKSTEKATQINSLLEDVVKAMQDNYRWENSGGVALAIDTIYNGNRSLIQLASTKGNGYLGLLVFFTIQYRCKFGNLASRV